MNFLDALYLEKTMSGSSTGTQWLTHKGRKKIIAISPVDGEVFAGIHKATSADYEHVVAQAEVAFPLWRGLPAPKRGEIVRQIGLRLRDFNQGLRAIKPFGLKSARSEPRKITS